MLHTANEEDILSGKVTDVYFLRTKQILEKKGIDKRVKVEFIVKSFPDDYKWGVLAGIEESLTVLKNLPVTVQSMPEGTIFLTHQPVLTIEGKYLEFGIYETSLLGLLCQASGVATKAARCRIAARDRTVISFGARRMHPAISPMIERNAYIGGCDGVAAVKSAELLGVEPVGTIPHALILILGDTVESIKSFHEIIDKKVKRVALIDTFTDEKFESLRAAECLGKELYAVRLDTPGSRRGDFLQILKEVRWELDLRGYNHVKLFISGGIDEYKIEKYVEYADAFGVGTSISNAPVLDFAMDIVEIDGKPLAKRGKLSGSKDVYRCPRCFKSGVVPSAGKVPRLCNCGSEPEKLLRVILKDGALTAEMADHHRIRSYVLRQLPHFPI